MKISSEDLMLLISSIAEDGYITTVEGLLEFLKNKNSVYEITS